ncbi:hypothetical protein GCM10027614_82380 [Micromonospora vulcania]
MRARRFRIALAALTALAAFGVTGCGDADPASPQPGSTASGVSGTITVFAAASLTESFTTIGKDFEAANPGTKVTFSFAGSSALATQINQGAPADVFASAAPANMKAVTDAGNGDGTPTTFVKNQLVIAVPKGNPNGVTGLRTSPSPARRSRSAPSRCPVARRRRRPSTPPG